MTHCTRITPHYYGLSLGAARVAEAIRFLQLYSTGPAPLQPTPPAPWQHVADALPDFDLPDQLSPTARQIRGPDWQHFVASSVPSPLPSSIDLANGPYRTGMVYMFSDGENAFVEADYADLERRIMTQYMPNHGQPDLQLPDGTVVEFKTAAQDALDWLDSEGFDVADDQRTRIMSFMEEMDDWEPPRPKDPGTLIFATGAITYDQWGRVDRVELLEYDHDGAFYWINDGVGIEWFVETADHDPVILEENAVYVCDGLTIHYTRGDGWTTDDDEDWEDYQTRPATIDEIAGLFGADFWNHDEGRA